jgi:hypothetical protein
MAAFFGILLGILLVGVCEVGGWILAHAHYRYLLSRKD